MTNKLAYMHTSIGAEKGEYHGEIWITAKAVDWRKPHETKAYRVKLEDFKNFMETHGRKVNRLTK